MQAMYDAHQQRRETGGCYWLDQWSKGGHVAETRVLFERYGVWREQELAREMQNERRALRERGESTGS